MVKYSPIKQLTVEQGQLITEIINNPNKNYVINGDADVEDQIGLVFAVQGIDLNKVGVMIGPDIKVNAEIITQITRA